MALDYTTIWISSFILIFYILAFFLLINTRKKLDGRARTAFTFFIITIFFLIIRRLQQVFVTSQILYPIPYSIEIISLLLAMAFLLAVFYFHKAIIVAHTERKFRDFRQKSLVKTESQKENISKRKIIEKGPKKEIVDSEGYIDLTK